MQKDKDIVLFHQPGVYAGWPANVGAWSWGDEILCGCTIGRYAKARFHNYETPLSVRLLRSLNGGATWKAETPDIDWGAKTPRSRDEIQWDHPDLVLRTYGMLDSFVCASGHVGAYAYSYDRGRTWKGPFQLFGELDHMCSTRTCYVDDQLFVSICPSHTFGRDMTFTAHLRDGVVALRAHLVDDDGWARAVMPSAVRVNDKEVFVALRRNDLKSRCWIEVVKLWDGFVVGSVAKIDTGGFRHNGNPPALTFHRNQFVLAYGRRDEREMVIRRSDDGSTWNDEEVIRDDFYAGRSGYGDLGYPVLLGAGGRLLCVYYWATEERPEQHIAGTWIE